MLETVRAFACYVLVSPAMLVPAALLASLVALHGGSGGGARSLRRSRVAGWASVLLLAALYAASTPVIATALLTLAERGTRVAADPGAWPPGAVLVVLAAERVEAAPEYGGPTIGALTLERIRYAAHLQRLTGLPIVASGGPAKPGQQSTAALMCDALTGDFGVTVAGIEERSLTTEENAAFSMPVVRALGGTAVVVVTHAWHMPRALASFAGFGLPVIAAPTGFASARTVEPGDLVPHASALTRSFLGLHELIGYAAYRVRGIGS
jgi:uncharacterized SAM-binding protein YcdF (DUF218 family)